jgi:hypothetical protein
MEVAEIEKSKSRERLQNNVLQLQDQLKKQKYIANKIIVKKD